MNNNANDSTLANFIWKNADDLWGDFKHVEFGKIILPFTLLRRLECVLEPTRDAVHDTIRAMADKPIDLDMVLSQVTGFPFKLCFGKHAEVRNTSADRYQRVVGTVYCDGSNANSELVRQGMAWVYVQYASKASPLFALEKTARTNNVGLWADRHAIPPWEWRRAGRADQARRSTPTRRS